MLTASFWLIATILMYFAATSALGDRRFGGLAAVLLPATPVLVRIGRPGSGPLLFVIVWLMALLLESLESRESLAARSSRGLWLVVAGASLGLGLYSGLTALVMMPLYLGVTLVWLFAYRSRQPLPFVLVLSTFAVAAAPFAIFIARHPDYLRDTIMRLRLYDARAYGVIRGVRELVSWTGLTARSGIYYDYFNPAFLFFSGETLGDALRRPEMFLMPFAVLVPAGIYRALTSPLTPAAALTLAGFLFSPAAAALMGPHGGNRIVYMVPFAVLLAALGAQQLLSSRSPAARITGWILIVAIPICFLYFYASLA